MVPENATQTVFTFIAKRYDHVIINATVDQNMSLSNNTEIVKPSGFENNPQTHFVKLRTEDNYYIQRNGRYINSTKIVFNNVTDLVEQAFESGDIIIEEDDEAFTDKTEVQDVTRINSRMQNVDTKDVFAEISI